MKAFYVLVWRHLIIIPCILWTNKVVDEEQLVYFGVLFLYLKPAEHLHSQMISQNGYKFLLCSCCVDYLLFAIKSWICVENEITLNICKEIKHKVGVSLSYEAILITILIYTKHSSRILDLLLRSIFCILHVWSSINQ